MKDYGEVKISDIDDKGLQAKEVLENIKKLRDDWKNWLFPLITRIEKEIQRINLQPKISNLRYKQFVKKFLQ